MPVPGTRIRAAVMLLTLAVGVVAGFVVLDHSQGWTSDRFDGRHLGHFHIERR
jgi:hypothetical protein